MIKTKNFNTNNKWPNILLIWAIHWNEKCWTKAINSIIKKIENNEIQIQKWNVTFIPIANQKAFDKEKRYIDINLNRVIKKHKKEDLYEQKLANEIIKIINKNNIVIDLHSSHTDDEEFIFLDYQDNKNKELAESCRIKNIITWWPELYKSTDESDTCKYAHEKWKIAITVECWNHFKEESVKIAENVIINVLSKYWIINNNIETNKIIYNKVNADFYIKKKKEWKLLKNYKHLQKVQKWEIIAEYEDWEKIISDKEYYILLPFYDAKIWDEWFYLWSKKS